MEVNTKMLYKAKLLKSNRDTVIATGEAFFDIEFEVTDSKTKKKVGDNIKLGFPITATAAEIKQGVIDYVVTLETDHIRNESMKEQDAIDTQAGETIAELLDIEGEEIETEEVDLIVE